MKKTINAHEFAAEFKFYNREDNFSHLGLLALYDYFLDYEDSTGEEITLDVIAICCEYSEYASLSALLAEYDNLNMTTLEDVEDRTTVILIPNTDRLIIQCF